MFGPRKSSSLWKDERLALARGSKRSRGSSPFRVATHGGSRHDPDRIRYGCFLPNLTGLATGPSTPTSGAGYRLFGGKMRIVAHAFFHRKSPRPGQRGTQRPELDRNPAGARRRPVPADLADQAAVDRRQSGVPGERRTGLGAGHLDRLSGTAGRPAAIRGGPARQRGCAAGRAGRISRHARRRVCPVRCRIRHRRPGQGADRLASPPPLLRQLRGPYRPRRQRLSPPVPEMRDANIFPAPIRW